MNPVLGFVPFILFIVLVRLSDNLALWVAFAAAFAFGIGSFLETRVLKTLDLASTAVFGLLALYKGFVEPSLSLGMELLLVEGSIFAVLLSSVLLQKPCTLQYAREQVLPKQRATRRFIRANYIVTGVWLAAFAVMTAADVAAVLTVKLSVNIAMATGLVALAGALIFSVRYSAGARELEPN
jgi:hypothetical protein